MLPKTEMKIVPKDVFAKGSDVADLAPLADQTGADLTGRDRLVSNVIFSWVGHSVLSVAGFIMPRMIDRHLGQQMLGVWDFGWSLVSYFFMIEAGISGAVSRYVAKYRTVGDVAAVNRIVSSGSWSGRRNRSTAG